MWCLTSWPMLLVEHLTSSDQRFWVRVAAAGQELVAGARAHLHYSLAWKRWVEGLEEVSFHLQTQALVVLG